jgi:TPR repeat protein
MRTPSATVPASALALTCVFALVAAFACDGQSTNEPAPDGSAASAQAAGTGDGAAATDGSAAGSGAAPGVQHRTDILLPNVLPPGDLAAACEAGELSACTDLGETLLPAGMQILNPAIPTPPDFERARGLHQRACDGGVDLACLRLALLISNQHLAREVPPADREAADALLQRLCGAEMGDACYHVARRGFDASNDAERLARELAALCRDVHDFSCQDLIQRYERGELQPLPDDRLFAYRYLCEGRPQFCLGLGVMEATGDGVERDPAAGYRHFMVACDAGFLHACLNAGLAGFNDGVVPPEEAVALWDRACTGGHGEACLRLAGLFWLGQPLPQDQPRSLAYLRRACEMRYTEACEQINTLCLVEGYAPACPDGGPESGTGTGAGTPAPE